jgi:acetoin utilization protein AcuA
MPEARCAIATRIVRFEFPRDLDRLRVADGFGAIVRTADVPAMFARTLAARGTITGALHDGVLVGYAADLPFVPIEWDGGRVDRRWDGLPEVRELGAVEVAAPFRNRGIARELMRALAAEGRLDRFIVIAEALHWHWDLASAGVDVWEYRRRLMRLLESAGFVRFDTDAPDVAEHAANFLAARIGNGTAPVAQRAFAQALFERAA